jgi:hypothetical protein
MTANSAPSDIQRIKDMKDQEPSKSPTPFAENADVAKPIEKTQAQDVSPSINDRGKGTDRPGFDLGGSSGDTRAGTGLGVGTDAFDTPGDRRLPGRQLDNKLTIPRWGALPQERTGLNPSAHVL